MLMKGSSTGTLAVVVVVAFLHPTLADWQYTSWGMSPEQAIAASNGRLKRCNQQECYKARTADMTARAVGSYQSVELKFTAYLLFDKNEKLGRVRLYLDDGAQRGLLIGALKSKYGEPTRKESGMGQYLIWYTQSDEVRLAMFSDETLLDYSPGLRGSDQGL